MINILDMVGEGFNKQLKVGIDLDRDAFSGRTIGEDDGAARVARFVILESTYKDGVHDWGLRSKEMSILDRPWGGPTVEMRWWRS